MGHRNLWALLAATLLMLVVIALQRDDEGAGLSSEVLFSDLKLRGPSLTRITVSRGEAPKIELRLSHGQWMLTSEPGYPADTLPVTELLRNLGEAKKLEAKTANPEFHARLGLAEPDSAEGAATLLTLKFTKGKTLKLLVGNAGQSGGQLVRMPGDNQVWLIDKPLLLPSTDMDWLNNEILNLPLDRIQSLTVKRADGQTITVQRDSAEQINFAVAELKDATLDNRLVNGMPNAFSVLSFNEVVPREQLTLPGKPKLSFTLKTFAGDSLTGELFEQAEQPWLRLGELKTAKESSVLKLTAPEGWLFRLQPYQYQALNQPLSALKAKAAEPAQ